MSLEADLLVDRRRLKRRLSLWRGLAVLAVLAAIAAVAATRDEVAALAGRGQVARLNVSGFISDDRRMIEALDRAAKDDNVRALIVAIDSPGGSVAGGEALSAAIARVRETKPVVAVMAGTAASAGYMIALPAERVLAREATLTGSIGVLLQTFEAKELLDRLGVHAEVLASGPLKAQPNPFQPLTDEGRAALRETVAELHGQFVAMVAAGRRMPVERVRELADGRIYTGRQAVALGLVDAIGGEREARAWLAAEKGVAEAVPTRDLEWRSSAERVFSTGASALIKSLVSEWLGVDLVRAVWQPGR